MNDKQLLAAVKWDEHGLLPAIVQDANSKEVLTLAYMNAASLRLTLKTGETWFWSRSRQELWHKGATSGNTQKVLALRLDCDGDALVVLVEPAGPACHTGARSCFYRRWDAETGHWLPIPGVATAEQLRGVPGALSLGLRKGKPLPEG